MMDAHKFFMSTCFNVCHQLRHLEEIRGPSRSSKSSGASMISSETPTSNSKASSVDLSPRSLEKHSRPIDHVIVETEVKGTIIERLELVEDRVLKVRYSRTCMLINDQEKTEYVNLMSF